MRFRFKGMKKYVEQLERLSDSFYANICVENAVTEGSKVVSKYTLEELQALPVDNSRPHKGMRQSINQLQKNSLISAWGVSPLDKRVNYMNRKTGVDRGTNKIRTKKYPNGQPHVTVARWLENGTSYMKKNPVFSRASRKARTPCVEAMQESLTEDITNLWNNKSIKRSQV